MCIYELLFICLIFILTEGVAAATAGAIFYGNSLLGAILFIWIAPRWILLQRDWRAMELFLDRYRIGQFLNTLYMYVYILECVK